MTTYRSNGHEIATGDPHAEVRIAAANRSGLLDELDEDRRVRFVVQSIKGQGGKLLGVDPVGDF
jgi:hypothetical protein